MRAGAVTALGGGEFVVGLTCLSILLHPDSVFLMSMSELFEFDSV